MSILVLILVKSMVTLGDYMVTRRNMSILLSRKIIHMGAACTVLFWPLFNDEHWTWRLNVLTCSLYNIELIFKGLIAPNYDDPDLKTLTRTGHPTELLIGPLSFSSVLFFTGMFYFRHEMTSFMMGTMGFGDGLAPLIGNLYPWGRYQSHGGEFKTVSGSAGMFLGSILGTYLVQYVAVGGPIEFARVVGAAATATLAEALSGQFDNIAVAGSVYFYALATDLSKR